MAAIRVRGLRKSYRKRGRNGGPAVTAVDGLDLEVADGEIVALLGPNGAGKSTTIEILEGYRDRDDGEVEVLGEDPGRAGPEWRSRIGIVLQNTRDLRDLTVAETIHTIGAPYPDPRPTGELLALVGLDGREKSLSGTLSGGLRRRLDVALGLVGRPELLFLDEPTTGFDPEARRQFWTLITDLRDAGTTILLTTHYLDEAEHLADRVAVIHHGTVIDTDTPARIGGRAEGMVQISYTGPDGAQVHTSTRTPTADVAALAGQYDGEIPDLTVTRPSLEDVYLRMIGDDHGAPTTTPSGPSEDPR